MTISSRTPEGDPNLCGVCGKSVIIEASTFPTRDAPCPHCGALLWFPENVMPSSTLADVSDIIFGTASLMNATLSVAELSSQARTLSFTKITAAEERKQAEYLFESFSVVD